MPNGIGIGSPRRQEVTTHPGGENYGGDYINGYKVNIGGPTALYFVFDANDRVSTLAA